MDPAIFVIDLEDANKKLGNFFCLFLYEDTFTSFLKIKSQKEVTKQHVGIKFLLTIYA
jgi:hypothetical protein